MNTTSQMYFFSWEDLSYSRTGVIFNGLKNSTHICQAIRFPRGRYLAMVKIILKVKKKAPKNSVLVVGSPCAILAILCRILWVRSKIVYDSGWPLIDGLESRKQAKFSAVFLYYKLYFIDFLAYRFSNKVAFESELQRKLCKIKFQLSNSKTFVSYTGVNELAYNTYLSKEVKNRKEFQIIFRGKYNLDSGLELLAKASWLFDSRISLIVISPNIPNNILFSPSVEIISRRITDEEFISYYKSSSLSIGQLGQSKRIERTIPHKFFESIYFNVPYLTQFSPAISELISSRDCVVYEANLSPKDFALKVLNVLSDRKSLEHISKSAKSKYLENCTQEKLVKNFLSQV